MAEKISLQKSYSRLNEALIKLFDENGVRRSFTVPYIEGQQTEDHIQAVGAVAAQSGGLTQNLLLTAHHAAGKGWGSGEGHTVGHSADKLRSTVIPKGDENAKAAIATTQKYLNDIGSLLGEKNPVVQVANGQLALVKKGFGAGMSLFDFGVMLIQLVAPPTQAVAKAVSKAHPNGPAPHLRAPAQESSQNPQEGAGAPQGEASPAGGGSEAQAAPEAQGAPATAAQAPPAAPAGAAPQAQG